MQRFIYPKIIPDLYYKKKAYKKICSPKYKKNMADKTRGGKQKNLSVLKGLFPFHESFS